MRHSWAALVLLALVGCTSAAPSASAPPTTSAPAGTAASPSAAAPSGASASPAASPALAASPSAVASPSAIASPAAGTRAPTLVRISHVSDSPADVWRYMAQDEGIFAKNGLQIDDTLISNPDAGPAALVSGQIDVANDGGPPALTAAAAGADLVMVTVTTPIWDFVLMAPNSIQSIEDLKGKVVGFASPGSPSDLAARGALQKHGLNPDTDVTMFNVGAPANRGPALVGGSVQAVTVTPPDDLVLEAQGFHVIDNIAQDNLPGAVQGMLTTRSFLTQHGDLVQAMVDSQVEAEALLHNNKDLAIQVMQAHVKYDDPQAYQESWDYFYGNPNVTPVLPYPQVAQFTDTQQALGQQNPAVAAYDVNNLLDTSLVQSAADRGLDKYTGS